MVRFKKKFYLFKVTDTWFRCESSLADFFSLRMYSYVQKPDAARVTGCIKSLSYTVELPLNKSMDEITAGFRKTVVQEIRKAETEGIQCVFRDDIDTFIPFFNDFAAAKKIYPAQRGMIESIGTNFKTTFAMLGNDILAAHSYIVDKELGVARLFQSASKRLDENFDRKLIGLANKLLTAKDIAYFKDQGFVLMDFGGYAENTEDKSLKGINEFKLSFGGQKSTCVNYHSVPYYILRKISEKLDRRY